jgi:WD40 repeat protein
VVRSIAYSPIYGLFSLSEDCSVCEWDLLTGRLIACRSSNIDNAGLYSLSLSNSLLACGGYYGIKLFSLPDWNLVNSLKLQYRAYKVLFDASGSVLLSNSSNGGEDSVEVWHECVM